MIRIRSAVLAGGLFAVLAATTGLAADLRATPGQLALNFGVPSLAPAAAVQIAATGILPTLPTPLPPNLAFVEIASLPGTEPVDPGTMRGLSAVVPGDVAAAIRAGDPTAFFTAAERHGYDLPEGDEIQEGLYQRGAELQAMEASRSVARQKPKATKFDDDAFAAALLQYPGLSLSPFRDADVKRKILLAAGYTHLKGGSGRISLDSVDSVQLGKAFERVFKAHKTRLGRSRSPR